MLWIIFNDTTSSKHKFHCPYQCLLFQQWGSSWSHNQRNCLFFINSHFLSVSPLTAKFSNFIEGLEVEQGADHTVNLYSSVLSSPLILIILGTMECSLFQTIDTGHEIIYLCRDYILHSFFLSLTLFPNTGFCVLSCRLECTSFFLYAEILQH